MKELYEENIDKVTSFLDEIYKDDQSYKSAWAKMAKRNVAFANGDQALDPMAAPGWIDNDPVKQQADSRPSAYQTNEIAPIIRTLVSYMTRAKPAVEVYPDNKDENSKNTARIADRILSAKYDIDHERMASEMAAFWTLAVGTVYAKDYWDPLKGPYKKRMSPDGEQVLSETGEPQYDRAGNNNNAILTPFTIGYDNSVLDFKEQPYIHESYLMDVDWAREAFDQDLPGYTGKAVDITDDGSIPETLNMFEQMKYSIPRSGTLTPPKNKGKCLVQEWYIRPARAWPKGRMIILAGGRCVYDSTREEGSPYFMEFEEVMWHPYTMFGYEPYIGRALWRSLVEMLVPLQVRLNEINGAILENANTLAKPNIMAAINQLKRGTINGKGANIYTYQPVPGGEKPYILEGTPLPQQFFKEKQDLIDQMVRLAGTNFVMQGQPPTGVTAASAISQLLENASGQHSNLMGEWEKFHEQRYAKKLRIIHRFHKHPDENLERYVRQFTKDALDGEIKDFVGQKDLSDGLVTKIEYGSMIPKSDTAKKEIYKDLAKNGLLGPIAEDSPRGAKLREQLLERLGEQPFDSEESIEVKKAKWENDRILRGEKVEVSPYDVHPIHQACHKVKIQDPHFLETATDQVKVALDDHLKAHDAAEAEKAAMAQAQAAGMPPAGPEGQPVGAPPPEAPAGPMAEGMESPV